MKVKGSLEYRDLEGGIWQLAADDGKRYTLLGARGDLKSMQGARVEVEGSLDEGFGISMSGPQLRVSKLRKL
jgi:formylmethanofuran dehydrogenase subunit C